MGLFSRKPGSCDRVVYQAEVEMTTASGESVTYRGSGMVPVGESGQQMLDGVEAAARAVEPGGRVTASRVRRATS